MSKDQKQEVERVNLLVPVESKPSWITKTTPTGSCSQGGEGEESLTTKSNYYNKQDGSYGERTSKETYSSRPFGRGGQGCRDEYKTTDTYKAGDSRGYTKYTVEEKTVTYDHPRNYNNDPSITHSHYDSDTIEEEKFPTVTYDHPRNYYNNYPRFTCYDNDSDSD